MNKEEMLTELKNQSDRIADLEAQMDVILKLLSNYIEFEEEEEEEEMGIDEDDPSSWVDSALGLEEYTPRVD